MRSKRAINVLKTCVNLRNLCPYLAFALLSDKLLANKLINEANLLPKEDLSCFKQKTFSAPPKN